MRFTCGKTKNLPDMGPCRLLTLSSRSSWFVYSDLPSLRQEEWQTTCSAFTDVEQVDCTSWSTLTWVVLFEGGKVGVGIKNGRNGWKFSQLLILLPALQTALVVWEAIALRLRWGGWWWRGGRSGWSGPGTFLAPVWTKQSSSVPVFQKRLVFCITDQPQQLLREGLRPSKVSQLSRFLTPSAMLQGCFTLTHARWLEDIVFFKTWGD